MSNRRSNFPNAQQPDVEPGETGELVSSIEELRALPAVREYSEVAERVKWFFQWCADHDLRPGVELLALSLGCSRQTLLNWQHEGSDRGHVIDTAKQVIAALTEQWGLTNRLNVAAFCFLMKNNYGYSDSVTIDTVQNQSNIPTRTAAEIADRYKDALELPEMERPEL
ncbi:terminase small subunit [Blautia massiliensis (ex Durand et al. 2017)]|jgi:hypothetical protein|uniref:terminase small subunit n=1 Tax=Blautia massiliensis (ex Durand et al. 2017) TaxID=1737424 RepID=UPI001896C7BD|nr:terminase small subunit [Blautia massiliensis (ex Durand et al. 2017)]